MANEVIMFAQEALSLRCDLAIIGHINKAIKRNSFQPNLNRGVECISQFLERVLSVEKRNSFKAHDDACKGNWGEKQRTVTILFTLVPKKKSEIRNWTSPHHNSPPEAFLHFPDAIILVKKSYFLYFSSRLCFIFFGPQGFLFQFSGQEEDGWRKIKAQNHYQKRTLVGSWREGKYLHVYKLHFHFNPEAFEKDTRVVRDSPNAKPIFPSEIINRRINNSLLPLSYTEYLRAQNQGHKKAKYFIAPISGSFMLRRCLRVVA